MSTETDIENLMEHAAYVWHFDAKDEQGNALELSRFSIYGAAEAPGQVPRSFAVTVDENRATVTMPGLPLCGWPWKYQLFVQDRLTRVEWLVAQGEVRLTERVAGGFHANAATSCCFTAVLGNSSASVSMVVGDNMAAILRAAQVVKQVGDTAAADADKAGKAARLASDKATDAARSAQTASDKATAADDSAKVAEGKATDAARSAQTAGEKATAADNSAKVAEGKATDAARSAQTASDKATAADDSAKVAEGKATDAARSAQTASDKAAAADDSAKIASDKAAAADDAADKAARNAAQAELELKKIRQQEAGFLEHMEDTAHHVTAREHQELQRLIAAFPTVGPDTPTVPDPEAPEGAVPQEYMRSYFALHAQPGASQPPPAVFMTRVPWARWDEEEKRWVNTATAVDEVAHGVTRKVMDNAGLVHTPSTDTVEGRDDYIGHHWPFYCGRCNFIKEAGHDVYHVTAIEGQVINGKEFDPEGEIGAFGPVFWYFEVLERYQDPETGNWTTHDQTADGVPLWQLWGISSRSWENLDDSRRAELERHGVTAADFRVYGKAMAWDAAEGKMVQRCYWCHPARMGGYEVGSDGKERLVSKNNAPVWCGHSHNSLNALGGYASGTGGSADINGFLMLFDIVKNGNKSSQKNYSGMSQNNCGAVLAKHATATADYVFPIASQGHFQVGGTVWLWQKNNDSATAATAKRGAAVQIGRVKKIETRTLTLTDGSTADSLCLVFDPATVQPFLVRTSAADAKLLTDEGTHACCYATQGVAMGGETDAVIGKHDGACTSLTNGRHPFRVQLTEFQPGVFQCATDVVAVKGTGALAVDIDGTAHIPTTSEYVILQATDGATRRSGGSLAQYLAAGYEAIGITPGGVSGFILNCRLSRTMVPYPVAAGGSGSSDAAGHGDQLWVGASLAEFLSGGHLASGTQCGAAYLGLADGVSHSSWRIAGRV